MSAAHTPGPWKWDGNVCDYDPTNEAPWIIAGALDETPVLTGEIKCSNPANARLIASAPDLLEVLQMVRDYIVLMKQPGHAYSVAVDAAIRKATGADHV